jgi:hypothetical protein
LFLDPGQLDDAKAFVAKILDALAA